MLSLQIITCISPLKEINDLRKSIMLVTHLRNRDKSL